MLGRGRSGEGGGGGGEENRRTGGGGGGGDALDHQMTDSFTKQDR